jgi:putative membrane protein
MKTKLIWVSALMMMWGFTACSSSDNKDTDNSAAADTAVMIDDSASDTQNEDTEFMTEAASGGMMEVELGQLASNKAVSADVKKFAKMMVDDHSKANSELKSLAAQKGITLPTMLMEKHQKMVNDLTAKMGKDFDKEYMNMMVDDHKEDIDAFEKAAEKGNDADLKAFAAKTIPTLKQHLEMAEKTEKITDKM